MSQGVLHFCNFFRNELCGTEIANTLDGEQHDIHIIGEGYAILDGGNTNWFLECNRNADNSQTENMGLKINNAILLHNVRDFSIENIAEVIEIWTGVPATTIKENEFKLIDGLEGPVENLEHHRCQNQQGGQNGNQYGNQYGGGYYSPFDIFEYFFN